MGIFSKKTDEPITYEDLAKEVEEYNRKFMASQAQNSEQESTSLVLEDIDPNAVDVARTEITHYVFVQMDEGPFSNALRSAFSDKKPNRMLLTAVAQVYTIALNIYATPEYSDEDRKGDSDLLKNYILKHYRDELYLIAVLTHAPIYAEMSVAKLIQHEQGGSWEQAIEIANKTLGTSMVELNRFGLSLIANISKQS